MLARRWRTLSFVMAATLVSHPVLAQASENTDDEIAALKRQLQLLESKLDKLQKQSNVRPPVTPKTTPPGANAALAMRTQIAF